MTATAGMDETGHGPAQAEPGSGGRGSGGAAAERLLFGGAAVLLAALFSIALFQGISQLRFLETGINDRLRVNLAPRMAGQDDRISIAALTEKTLIQYPYRSPIDRGLLANLIETLGDAGARALVIDVIFDQPTEPAKDEALIQALRAFPGEIVAVYGDESAGLIPEQIAYQKLFEERSGVTLGFANLLVDEDGVVRQYATRLPGIDRLSLSGAIAKKITGQTPPETGVIDWRRPQSANATLFQQFPAHQLIQFSKNPALAGRVKGWLDGRIVFIGADLKQRDRLQTSLSADLTLDRTLPGVVIQATILSQLLDQREVPNATQAATYALVALLAAVGAVIGLSRADLLWKAASLVVVLVGYLTIVYFLSSSAAFFLPVAPVVAALFTSFLLSIGVDSFLTQRDERFIRLAFSHYLEPSMVDQLADDPQALRLGGDRREMSLIFTDIAGFTTMSEELPPDQLTRLLNDYFDGMSEIIIAHGGAIDKFIGDAVVAHFGAPTPMADHALKALQCAAELDKFGEAFRRRHAHLGLGVTRIGVHTGVATVGNFGGRARFDYTAMGDAVNTAARLESTNKRYGTRVGVSQETAEHASAMAGPEDKLPILQTIGQIMLKGKTKPVTVYTINNDADEEFVWAYEAAFSMIDVDFVKARKALDELLRANPTDPLLKWHLARFERGDRGTMIDGA